MRFFFDRNLSRQLALMLNHYDAEHQVTHLDLDKRFCPTTPDIEWMRVLAADDTRWIIISGDGRILKNKAESTVLRETKLNFFCLSKQWINTPFSEQAWKLVKVWPKILKVAKDQGTTQGLFEVSFGSELKVERINK